MVEADIYEEWDRVAENVDAVARLGRLLLQESDALITSRPLMDQVTQLAKLEMIFGEITTEVKLFKKSRKALVNTLGAELIHSKQNTTLDSFTEPDAPEEMPKTASFEGEGK